jgi:TM2 domain-containing membrane protein YozV
MEGNRTMSRSVNAVLLSALVLPGAGHLYLKHYARGIALIAFSLACLWVIVDRAMQLASTILEQFESAGGALDPGQVSDLVARASNSSGSSVATLVLAGCWLFGMVDAYRLGRNESDAAAQRR